MLTVADVVVRDPVVVTPDVPLTDAAALMHERNINSVVVMDGSAIAGILTSRDVMRWAADRRDGEPTPTVRHYMTAAPRTVDIRSAFSEALELMDLRHIRHLPVTEHGKLVGIISIRDLMQHRALYLQDLVEEQTRELRDRNEKLRQRDERMEFNLELAGRVQRELLPNLVPTVPPLSLAVLHRPRQQVSGDSYDFIVSPDQVGLLVADARGHGVPAAFVSVMARMVFQAIGHDRRSPATVLTSVNDRLPPLIQADHFITMWYGRIERRSLVMTWASAGHPPPLRRRSDTGEVEPLRARGDMIGIVDDASFEERSVQLTPGDAVLIPTDGVLEARAPELADGSAGELFGETRLARFLQENGGDPPDTLVEALEDELSRFCGHPKQFGDDVTCLALRVD